MEGRIGADRVDFIANVCRTNSWFNAPLEEKGITADEWEAFVSFAEEYARISESRASGVYPGSVEVEMVFSTHSGKVGQDDEKWNVLIPHRYTDKVLRVAESGTVIGTLASAQVTVPMSFDPSTGEVVS